MSELPRLTRSMRANLRLEIQRNIKFRPEDRVALQLWRTNEQKKYLFFGHGKLRNRTFRIRIIFVYIFPPGRRHGKSSNYLFNRKLATMIRIE